MTTSLSSDSLTYIITSAPASNKAIGNFNPTPSYCIVTYSLVWASNNSAITTMPIFSISGGNLVVGTSTDNNLITNSPYSIKVKAVINLRTTPAIAY